MLSIFVIRICIWMVGEMNDFNSPFNFRIKISHLFIVIMDSLCNKKLLKIKMQQKGILAVVWFHTELVLFGLWSFLLTMCSLMWSEEKSSETGSSKSPEGVCGFPGGYHTVPLKCTQMATVHPWDTWSHAPSACHPGKVGGRGVLGHVFLLSRETELQRTWLFLTLPLKVVVRLGLGPDVWRWP